LLSFFLHAAAKIDRCSGLLLYYLNKAYAKTGGARKTALNAFPASI
jgi:hypothetical protein